MDISLNGSLITSNNGTFSDSIPFIEPSNEAGMNKSLLLTIISTPPNSGSVSGPSARDFYLGIRFIILICVFVSVYLIIWLAQRQLTKAFEKSHESQNEQQRNRNLLCPLLFLLPMTTTARTGGGTGVNGSSGIHPSCNRRRSCSCPTMALYNRWHNSSAGNWSSRNNGEGIRCGDADSTRRDSEGDNLGSGGSDNNGESSPPKYEDILLFSPGDGGIPGDLMFNNPPSYEDARRMRGEDPSPLLNAYLV